MTKAPTTRETADHAELAALCARLRSGRMTDGTRIRAAMKIEALLSEIAALRGEVENLYREDLKVMALSAMDDDLQAMTVRATQAERQRDELREALGLAAERFEALRDLTDHVPHRIACSTWADEARLANQGADQSKTPAAS